MTKRRLTIKDKKLKELLKNGGRAGARKDFDELLWRAVSTPNEKPSSANAK